MMGNGFPKMLGLTQDVSKCYLQKLSNCSFQKCLQLYVPQYVNSSSFRKDWQTYVLKMLANIIFGNVSGYKCQRG